MSTPHHPKQFLTALAPKPLYVQAAERARLLAAWPGPPPAHQGRHHGPREVPSAPRSDRTLDNEGAIAASPIYGVR